MHRLFPLSRVSPRVALSDPARSGDWGRRAKHLARRLSVYTPVPLISSSNESLRRPQSVPVARPRRLIGLVAEWVSIFKARFLLRCFQRLSLLAWLLGSALSDNR